MHPFFVNINKVYTVKKMNFLMFENIMTAFTHFF